VLAGEGLLAAFERDGRAIGRALVAAAGAPFAAVRAITVEDAIAARADCSPRARLGALKQAALPAINLDLTRLPGGDAALRRIEVLGVPDHTATLFRGEADHIVSIHDPHEVLALALSIGVPYTALQAWPEYLAAYERAARVRPLHTLPAYQARQQDHRLALGLGLVFELIRTRGSWFYYRPADPLADEVQLAQGGENTIRVLGVQEGLVRDLLWRVEAHIEQVGTERALESLWAWCGPQPADDALARDLKRLVRDYAAVVRGNARLARRPAEVER